MHIEPHLDHMCVLVCVCVCVCVLSVFLMISDHESLSKVGRSVLGEVGQLVGVCVCVVLSYVAKHGRLFWHLSYLLPSLSQHLQPN